MGFLDFLSPKKKIEEKKQRLQRLNNELNLFINQVKTSKSLTPINTHLVLQENENAYLKTNTTLLETRSVRYHKRSGLAFRVMRGGYVGGGGGASESQDEWRVIDKGILTLTNQRLVFDGDKEDRVIPLKKIISVNCSLDSIEVSTETRKKSMVFPVKNPLIWTATIQLFIKTSGDLGQLANSIETLKINIISESEK